MRLFCTSNGIERNLTGGNMAILETFTTVGPMAVCYPRLNTTLPLRDVKMNDPSAPLNSESFHLVNKAEGLGLDSAVRLLLVEEPQRVL